MDVKTKRIWAVSVVVAVAALMLPVSLRRVKVDAGCEVVLVKKPMFFGHGGVVQEPVKTGSVWVARTTEGLQLPVTPIQVNEPFDDMTTRNKSLVDFNSAIKLRITDTSQIIDKWGTDWYPTNIQSVYHRMVRDQVQAYAQDELMADKTVIKQIETNLEAGLRDLVKRLGMPIDIQDVVINKVLPNKPVMDEIDRTAAQQQRKNTENQRKEAEDARKGAEMSKAAADNAYRMQMGLNPEQFIQNENIKAFIIAADRCAASKDCTLVIVPPGQNMTLPRK